MLNVLTFDAYLDWHELSKITLLKYWFILQEYSFSPKILKIHNIIGIFSNMNFCGKCRCRKLKNYFCVLFQIFFLFCPYICLYDFLFVFLSFRLFPYLSSTSFLCTVCPWSIWEYALDKLYGDFKNIIKKSCI